MKRILEVGGIILFLLLFFLFAVEEVYRMPDNAILYADLDNNSYLSPVCIDDGFGEPASEGVQVIRMTFGEAKELGLKPDRVCKDVRGFHDGEKDSIRLITSLVNKYVYQIVQTRWNEDGTWNW